MRRADHGGHRRGTRAPRGLVVAAAGAVLVAYAAVLYALPKGVFLAPDEGGKFLMLYSMEWTPDGLTYHIAYGGQGMDPDNRFYPRMDDSGSAFPYPMRSASGAVLFHWQIWFPLACRALRAAFGLGGIYLVPLLAGWLTALLSGWLTERLRPGLAPLAIVLVGLGTPVFFYSVSFWEHTTASLLGLLAVALCVVRPSALSYLAAGVLVLAGTLFRIELVLLGGGLLLACVASAWATRTATTELTADPPRRRRGRVAGTALSLSVLAVLVAWQLYGHLPPRLHVFIDQIPRRLSSLPHVLPNLPQALTSVLINTPTEEGPEIAAPWSQAALGALGLCLLAPLLRRTPLEGPLLLAGLLATLAFSVRLLTAGPDYRAVHGVLAIVPFAAFAPYAVAAAWRTKDPKVLRLGLVALAYLAAGVGALFVTFVGPTGEMVTGLEWGQRYLLPLYPMVAILALIGAADLWQSERPRRLRRAALLLMAIAMGLAVSLEVRGLRMLRSELRVFSKWDAALRSDGPIVTDVWWLPTALPELFVTRPVYYVAPGHLDEWATFAAARHMRRFVFVAFDIDSDEPADQVAGYHRGAQQQIREMTLATFEVPTRAAGSLRRGPAAPAPPSAAP